MSDVQPLAAGFRTVSAAFRAETGRPPRLVELLDLLAYGARNLPAEALSDAHPDEISGFGERPRAKARATEALDDLDDATWEQATVAFTDWWKARAGGPMTADQLGAAVCDALRLAGGSLLDDQSNERLVTVSPKLKRAKARATIGDIVAIPAGGDEYHFAVLIDRNRFGSAYGPFRGRYALDAPITELAEQATGIARYSDERPISAGRWQLVGHDEALLAHFPTEPELFHGPGPDVEGQSTGEFGAAETVGGTLRLLGESEARAVGLYDGTYVQTAVDTQFEAALTDLLAKNRA